MQLHAGCVHVEELGDMRPCRDCATERIAALERDLAEEKHTTKMLREALLDARDETEDDWGNEYSACVAAKERADAAEGKLSDTQRGILTHPTTGERMCPWCRKPADQLNEVHSCFDAYASLERKLAELQDRKQT